MFQMLMLSDISVDELSECVLEAPGSVLDMSWSIVEASGDVLQVPPSVL